jgi:hypothetical protein
MEERNSHLSALQDIKHIMERSSRFISLSGWSGVSAGICGIAGAWFAHRIIYSNDRSEQATITTGNNYERYSPISIKDFIGNSLFNIAILTFIAAFVFAFLFTYLRSKKNNVPLWGNTARRLMLNVCIPMIAGGIFLLKLIETGAYGLVAPACLIFYGLALVNGSKYTLSEVRYLGYGQILLGVLNCWDVRHGLYFWAAGFGILHIVYGILMWYRYERA